MAKYGLLTLSLSCFYCPINNITLSLSLSLSLYTLVGSTLVLLHKNLKEFSGPTKNITPSLFLSSFLPPFLPPFLSLSLLGVGCNIIWLSVGCWLSHSCAFTQESERILHKTLFPLCPSPDIYISPSLTLSIGGGLQYNMSKYGLLTLSLLCFVKLHIVHYFI
jgi:hypothetical protein